MLFKSDQELNEKELLKIIDKIVEDKHSIIERFGHSARYYDEPFLYQYFVKLKNKKANLHKNVYAEYGGGASFEEKKALIKAVCEALERFCLSNFERSNFEKAHFPDFKDLVSFSVNQLKHLPERFQVNRKDKFYCVKGISLHDNRSVVVPAQFVFVPYHFNNEKIVRLPISTGGASGTSLCGALTRGILEVIERDAFMLHYLNKIWGQLIDFSSNTKLLKIKEYFKKYNLELYLINLKTDLNVYTIMTLIIDRTGVGPAVSAGLKSGLDPYRVAIGSIEEGWHSRPWIRDDLNFIPDLKQIMQEGKSLTDLKKRGLFWADVSMIKHVNMWFKKSKSIKFSSLHNLSKENPTQDLQYIVNELREKDHDIYYVDITRPEVKKYGFVVIKAIIPSLQPLHLDEPYIYLGGRRLYETPLEMKLNKISLTESDLNDVPHFFL